MVKNIKHCRRASILFAFLMSLIYVKHTNLTCIAQGTLGVDLPLHSPHGSRCVLSSTKGGSLFTPPSNVNPSLRDNPEVSRGLHSEGMYLTVSGCFLGVWEVDLGGCL